MIAAINLMTLSLGLALDHTILNPQFLIETQRQRITKNLLCAAWCLPAFVVQMESGITGFL